MVLKFCLPAIDHALGTASRLAVSGSQGTRRRSLPRRAARRYIAIPGAPRGRHSRPPRFLHIRGPRGGGALPPGPAAGLPWETAGAPGSRRAGKAKRAGPRRAPLCTYMEVPSTGQRRPALPRASPAVPSALGGLASGFGMGPGVPRPPWPLTGGRRSAHFNFASSFIHAVSIPMQEMFTNSISASNDKQEPFYTSKCMGALPCFLIRKGRTEARPLKIRRMD